MTLKLEHISKTFGEGLAKTNVLKDINLEVQPGEFIILMVHQVQVNRHY